MRLYLPEIKKQQGRAFPWCYAGLVPAGFEAAVAPGDTLEVELEASAAADKILLQGVMRVALTVSCSRCLKPFRQNLKTDLRESFSVRSVAGRSEENRCTRAGEAANELVVSGDFLYLEEYLRQHFLLMQELKPLCRVDCPGICPLCGADRAGDGCSCGTTPPGDPRLSKLKDLLS